MTIASRIRKHRHPNIAAPILIPPAKSAAELEEMRARLIAELRMPTRISPGIIFADSDREPTSVTIIPLGRKIVCPELQYPD